MWSQASLQHVDNLTAIIEEGIQQNQLSRVAGASSLLIPHLVSGFACTLSTITIQTLPFNTHPEDFHRDVQATKTGERKYRPSETQRTMRQLHAVEAGLECLLHPPQAVNNQQLMRLLRQVQVCDLATLTIIIILCWAPEQPMSQIMAGESV